MSSTFDAVQSVAIAVPFALNGTTVRYASQKLQNAVPISAIVFPVESSLQKDERQIEELVQSRKVTTPSEIATDVSPLVSDTIDIGGKWWTVTKVKALDGGYAELTVEAFQATELAGASASGA